MLRDVALVRSNVSEEISHSFIRVTRIGELETALAVASNRRTLRRTTRRNIPDDAILRIPSSSVQQYNSANMSLCDNNVTMPIIRKWIKQLFCYGTH
jgi:hypothetical protein